MQKIIISGNLTADPVLNEREYTNKETAEIIKTKVCNFSVAVNEGYGDRKTTTYFRVNAWRGLGETCAQWLKKGRGVLVVGAVSLNNYVDKNQNLRAVMEIRADEVQFLSDGKGSVTTPTEQPAVIDDEETPY